MPLYRYTNRKGVFEFEHDPSPSLRDLERWMVQHEHLPPPPVCVEVDFAMAQVLAIALLDEHFASSRLPVPGEAPASPVPAEIVFVSEEPWSLTIEFAVSPDELAPWFGDQDWFCRLFRRPPSKSRLSEYRATLSALSRQLDALHAEGDPGLRKTLDAVAICDLQLHVLSDVDAWPDPAERAAGFEVRDQLLSYKLSLEDYIERERESASVLHAEFLREVETSGRIEANRASSSSSSSSSSASSSTPRDPSWARAMASDGRAAYRPVVVPGRIEIPNLDPDDPWSVKKARVSGRGDPSTVFLHECDAHCLKAARKAPGMEALVQRAHATEAWRVYGGLELRCILRVEKMHELAAAPRCCCTQNCVEVAHRYDAMRARLYAWLDPVYRCTDPLAALGRHVRSIRARFRAFYCSCEGSDSHLGEDLILLDRHLRNLKGAPDALRSEARAMRDRVRGRLGVSGDGQLPSPLRQRFLQAGERGTAPSLDWLTPDERLELRTHAIRHPRLAAEFLRLLDEVDPPVLGGNPMPPPSRETRIVAAAVLNFKVDGPDAAGPAATPGSLKVGKLWIRLGEHDFFFVPASFDEVVPGPGDAVAVAVLGNGEVLVPSDPHGRRLPGYPIRPHPVTVPVPPCTVLAEGLPPGCDDAEAMSLFLQEREIALRAGSVQ